MDRIIDVNGIGEFKEVPGFPGYFASKCGIIYRERDKHLLSLHLWGGYYHVSTVIKREAITLRVSRAVALAWIPNPDPSKYTVVNHLDGVKTNNAVDNLEWTTYSGNNYHAINTGLRKDNIPCEVRDFYTKEVVSFPSIAQACTFMGMGKDSSFNTLNRKKFGTLLKGRYEFRYALDEEPWFYEDRTEIIPRSRYMIIARSKDGTLREIYSTRAFLKEYQLYGSSLRSIPDLVKYANSFVVGVEFCYRDSYFGSQYRTPRAGDISRTVSVCAMRGDETLRFDSVTKCANHFGVDRSVVLRRLNRPIKHDDWIFVSENLDSATLISNGQTYSS